ncbi:MAG: hypothetical protein KIT22_05745 [Verrucomicrobiae bacterium]|nr:hypothetical protein [Verrucomicrobiae bacterium]
MATGGPDLEIKIRTRADLKGARDLEASLKSQIASLKRLGADSSVAEAQLKKVQAAIKGAPVKSGFLQQTADSLRRIREQGGAAATAITGFTKLISSPIAAVTAMTGALAAGFAGAVHAIKKYAEADDEIIALDAALAQNQLLTEETRTKYRELADELERTTSIAGGTWTRVLAHLTNYGSKPETIGMDIAAVKNLAALLDGGEGGVTQAAQMWSRAISGNLTWLRRFGIEIDESVPKHRRLQVAMEELAARGAGQLEARAKSLSGQFRTLKNQSDQAATGVGGMLMVLLGPFQRGAGLVSAKLLLLIQYINGFRDSQSVLTNATKATTRATEDAAEAMDTYTTKVEDAIKAIRDLQRAQDEVADAELAARLAVVDSAEARGQIPREEAIRRRFGLRQAAADARLENTIAANIATIRTLDARLPGLEANKDESGARSIQQQIRDLDAQNLQAVRLRNVGRFTESMGAADDLFRAHKDGLPQGVAADTRAGLETLGGVVEESLDRITRRLLEKTARLEDQIRNGNR